MSHRFKLSRLLAVAVGLAITAPVAVLIGPADAATVTTAWQNGSFSLNADSQSMPLGNGSLGVAAWAANGFTAQLNRSTDGLHVASSSGANLSGNINVPATGGWQTWTTVTATVTLPAGQQTLTIDQDNGGWNIHQLTFA
jgi:hypothetical protein